MRVGIINVTGYAGAELARILYHHPEVEIASVTGRSAAGKRLPEAVPHLWRLDLPITSQVEEPVDLVFSSLPSGASAEALAPLVEDGVRAVDIAADFRLHDPEGFRAAYKMDHRPLTCWRGRFTVCPRCTARPSPGPTWWRTRAATRRRRSWHWPRR